MVLRLRTPLVLSEFDTKLLVCNIPLVKPWKVWTIYDTWLPFYEYMQFLANHEVNPLIISPLELWDVLLDTKQNINLHPYWSLPDDPNDTIWA